MNEASAKRRVFPREQQLRCRNKSSIFLILIIGSLLLNLAHTAIAQKSHTVPPHEQLTNQDISKIISILGGSEEASASAPIAATVASPDKFQHQESGRQGLPAANPAPSPAAPTQQELLQSLSLLNSLISSGGISSDTASLLGLGSLVPPTPTTTTTTSTTENSQLNPASPNINLSNTDAATAAILNSLLGAAGGGGGGAGGADATGLAALLGLAAAAGQQQQQQQKQQQQQQQQNTPGIQAASSQSAADAQSAALLTNLLLSASQPGAAGAGVKQQDFQSFQNAGLNLDQSSSNQLSGALGLLGALSSFASPQQQQQPSIFNLGGQSGGLNLLSTLLGAAGGGAQSQQNNLLAGLLGGGAPQQQQAQRPGLLSSLGNLATVVGGTLSGARGDGKPRVRGVDTRLGVGYRFGENADAQVVWEIGPQLFTEPLTDEQKQQLLIQQQQQQLQQQQNINRRLHVVPTSKSHSIQVQQHKQLQQQHQKQQQQNQKQQLLRQQQQQQQQQQLLLLQQQQHQNEQQLLKHQQRKQQQLQLQQHKELLEKKLQQQLLQHQQHQQQQQQQQQQLQSSFERRNMALDKTNHNLDSDNIPDLNNLRPSPSTTATILHQVLSPPQFYSSTRLISPVAVIQHSHRQNYYAKEEADPRSNEHSQLTEYERYLLFNSNNNNNNHQQKSMAQSSHENSNRNQVHEQHLLVHSKPNPNAKKMDSFIFSKDNTNNIVRVRIQPRENLHKVQILQSVGNAINKRIGSYGYDSNGNSNTHGNSASLIYGSADDSYARRNAMVYNSNLREIERKNEREEYLLQMQAQRQQQSPSLSQQFGQRADEGGNRQTPTAHAPTPTQTLSEWSNKNSMIDLVQNYVLTGLQSQGNNLVKNFFKTRDEQAKDSAGANAAARDTNSKHENPQAPASVSSTASSSILPNLSLSTIKGILGISSGEARAKAKAKARPPTTPRPVVKVGDHVSYDDLQSMITGSKGSSRDRGKVVPVLEDLSGVDNDGGRDGPIQFGTPSPEIFIDLTNGEVSMRKPFGTMESFEPTTEDPVHLLEDSPKHVFKVLRQQLHEEYQRVKLEQLKEAAKQRRKENIAYGLSNPQDPIYLANKYFDLLEQEERSK